MSLKSIEMQVALPRTLDAGKLHEQLQQRGQLQNDHANESVQKEKERLEKTVIKQEQKDIARFHKEENKRDQDQQLKKRKEKEERQQKEQHPYKGTLVDFSG